MAYNNNVPLASQRIKDTQAPIRDNFAELDTYTQVNHEALNTADAGKHKFVTLTRQAVAPVAAATEINFFNATSSLTSTTELFMKKGAATEIEMTAGDMNTNGWTLLPSGLLMLWIRAAGLSAGVNTITYSVAVGGFPGFTGLPFCAQVTPLGSPNTLYVSALLNLTIEIVATGGSSAGVLVFGAL